MTAEEICSKVGGSMAVDAPGVSASSVYVGDLLSDVMCHAGEKSVLVTIQNHLNTIAVATLVKSSVVVLCHSRSVPADMEEGAKREGVGIICTSLSQYEVAQRLSELPPSKR
jgi:hypothetical protein